MQPTCESIDASRYFHALGRLSAALAVSAYFSICEARCCAAGLMRPNTSTSTFTVALSVFSSRFLFGVDQVVLIDAAVDRLDQLSRYRRAS